MVNVTAGDTIRLDAHFETFGGVAANPTTVTLKIYDQLKNVLLTATSSTDAYGPGIVDDAVGSWYYDYTTINEGVHFYEFYGLEEGYMISDKGTFYVTWA